MQRNGRIVLVAAAVAALLNTGCFKTPKPTLEQTASGLCYVFPGISGGAWYLGDAYRGYRDAGVESEVRIDEWEKPLYDGLGHLSDYDNNRRHARIVAEEIEIYRKVHPAAPIDLVGYSAGGGIAVMVTEALPPTIGLRNVVLVQCAVAPDYDLREALRRIDGRIVNIHSDRDWFVLGLGTRVFGTVDRTFTESAGKTGFKLKAAVPDEDLREKVVQQPWSPKMAYTGHWGQHGGILLYQWNRDFVAPWLLPEPRAPSVPQAARPSGDTQTANSRSARPAGAAAGG
jgi:pimeloyl-ACP methyl ester carboxylesterase